MASASATKRTLRQRVKAHRPTVARRGYSGPHNLKLVQSRRSPGLQRASLRSYVDKITEFGLALDPQDVGEREEWYRPGRQDFDIPVEVGPIEFLPQFTPGANGKTVVWYYKKIIVTRRRPGKHYKINFARAFYRTRVWANGELLTDVDGRQEHISGFSSFSYDLTEYIRPDGTLDLVVRVENSDDPAICRGKQWSRQYARAGIWYGQASGLWGQVTLEEVSANRLRSDITGYADPRTGLVNLQALSYITDAGSYEIGVALAGPDGQPAAEYSQRFRLEPGQHTHRLTFALTGPRRWSPDSPALYEAVVTLRRQGQQLDRVFFNLGFRSLEVAGERLLLNGRPVYLDGVLYQPYHGDSFTLSYEQLRADLEYTRRLAGANLLRIHIAGADPLPLYLADKLGLLVWVEVPSPHVSSPASRENHRRELESLLRQIDAHPCVAVISIYNESWGCQDVGDDTPEGRATRQYIREAYRYIKRERPDLLVVDNDGWEHVCEDGRLVATDLLTLHIYENDPDKWAADLAGMAELAEADSPRYRQLTGHSPVAGDYYRYRNELPALISEWGGFGALYGGPAAQYDKFKLIRRYKRVLLDNSPPLAGDCYTQLGDVEEETNGLLDKERARLADPEFLEASGGLLEGGRPSTQI